MKLSRIKAYVSDALFLIVAVVFTFWVVWWSIAALSGLKVLIEKRKPYQILRTAALCGLAWLFVALIRDITTGFRLSSHLAGIMLSKAGSPGIFLHATTFLIASALGGSAALFSSHLKLFFVGNKALNSPLANTRAD